MSERTKKLWGGRFSQATDPAVERFSASVHFDRALANYDLRGSMAHARMLAHVGLIPEADAETLVSGLQTILEELAEGSFQLDPALEDIHMNIEARLGELVGPVAGRLHTGRSRNDQVATDTALYLRETCLATRRGLLELRQVLVERCAEHLDTVLPGYTHLQRAQPVRLAHHWLAFVEMFGRDAQRFASAGERLALSPLGSGALAGSTLPLDREHTADALGFEAPSRNSMDSVSCRDSSLEFLADAAISMVHLSRLAEELVLWSSAEFGFIELADAYSTGSSLMPQKKNPDVPELVRGKAGRAIGNLVTLLTVMKGLPLTYNRDMQEDKEPLFDSARTLRDSLEVMSGALATLEVKAQRMREAADDPMLLATGCAREWPSARRTRSWARSWPTAAIRGRTCARSIARSCSASTPRFRPAVQSFWISSGASSAGRSPAEPPARRYRGRSKTRAASSTRKPANSMSAASGKRATRDGLRHRPARPGARAAGGSRCRLGR